MAAINPAIAVVEESTLPDMVPCIASTHESHTDSTVNNLGVPISARTVTTKLVGYVQNGNRVTGDPGMTISISREKGTVFKVDVSTSLTGEANVVFAAASQSTGIGIGTEWKTTTTESGSYQIPNGKRRGWISIGSDKYEVTSRVTYSGKNCRTSIKTVTHYGISKGASFKRGLM